MYKINDGRGQHMLKIRASNLGIVESWLIENPDKNMKECSKGTGLSYSTTRSLIKELRLEGK